MKRRTQLIVLAATVAGTGVTWWLLRDPEPEVAPIFPSTDTLWDEGLSRFDPDQSGAIEPAEFERFRGPWSFSLTFEDYDSSGDGRIDASELRAHLSSREPRPLVDKTIERSKREYMVVIEALGSSPTKLVAAATLLVEYKFIHEAGKCGHIEDVVVDSSARGLGLGKIIIRRLVELAHEAGCYKVILDCSEKNVAFYNRCGFTQNEVCMAHYFDKK